MKTKTLKAKIIGISVASAVVAALAIAIIYVGPIDVAKPPQGKDEFEGWNRSGPFAINKYQYKLGENIFVIAEGLSPADIGNMVFVMPNGTTRYITIPFDGSDKTDFNQYFKPAISKARKICSIDDLVGNWTVVLSGTNYEPIRFEFLNETLRGDEALFERVC
jgi:hypothetical protein